jgi:hypothetical protein
MYCTAPGNSGNPNSGALTKFDISKNMIRAEGGKALAAGLKGNQAIIELNIADNELGYDANVHNDMSGIVALADVIPGMGALSSVNLLKNYIDIDQAKALVSILKEHPTLKSLCGNSGDETELDMSGKEMRGREIIMLAPEIADNGAMSKFTCSGDYDNSKPVTMETTMTEADFSGKALVEPLRVSGGMLVAAFLPKCQ